VSVSVSEILAGAAAQAVPLSAECAGYLVLAAADQSAVTPRRIGAGEVCLFEDGAVRVMGGAAADEGTTERDLRDLLGDLLFAASSPTSGLLRIQRRAVGNGVGALQRELETALIPVNRAAARRALARLARETARAKLEGRLAELPAPKPRPASVAPAAPAASLVEPPVPAPPAPVVMAPVPVAPPVPVEANPVTASPAPVDVTAPFVMPPVASAAQAESETVPEPIIQRRTMRPPPPPPAAVLDGASPVEPLVPLAQEPRVATPVLGTRIETTDPMAADVLVTFGENERTVIPEDGELIMVDADGRIENAESIDLTEPCPPISESSEAPAVVADYTPLPHLPMPRPRASDVDDLIARLQEAPIAVGEVRAGLKRLAGLEPTPPPPPARTLK